MQPITDTNVNPYTNRSVITAFGYWLRLITTLVFFRMANLRSTINLNCNYFFPSILEPFLKNVIRNFILNTKRLEGFSMRKSLSLVLKVKTFQIFTAIHNSINLVGSEVITFN